MGLTYEQAEKIIKKMLFSYRADEELYVEYLRKGGAEIGDRVRIFDPRTTIIDVTRPYMLKIGDDVQITSGVTVLTHGYDWSVLKGMHGEVLGSCGEVVIGNNCFIGMHSTILKGVHIGNNCVIGANSLVNRDVPDGWVAAGNPAKLIMPIDKYYEKRSAAQLSEAEELYRCYVKRMGKEPSIDVFDEYFWLFQERDENTLTVGAKDKIQLVGNYEYSLQLFKSSAPMFDGFDAFIEHMRSL